MNPLNTAARAPQRLALLLFYLLPCLLSAVPAAGQDVPFELPVETN